MTATSTALVIIPGVFSAAPIIESESPAPTLRAARTYLKRALPSRRVAGSQAYIVRADGRVFERRILDNGQWLEVA